jgi:hypothetical protein
VPFGPLQNSRRGDFSRPKVRGRRVLELGAGMGLAGMALALLGAGGLNWVLAGSLAALRLRAFLLLSFICQQVVPDYTHMLLCVVRLTASFMPSICGRVYHQP